MLADLGMGVVMHHTGRRRPSPHLTPSPTPTPPNTHTLSPTHNHNQNKVTQVQHWREDQLRTDVSEFVVFAWLLVVLQ